MARSARKDKADAALITLEGALLSYAGKHGLAATWVDAFFLPPGPRRAKVAVAPET